MTDRTADQPRADAIAALRERAAVEPGNHEPWDTRWVVGGEPTFCALCGVLWPCYPSLVAALAPADPTADLQPRADAIAALLDAVTLGIRALRRCNDHQHTQVIESMERDWMAARALAALAASTTQDEA